MGDDVFPGAVLGTWWWIRETCSAYSSEVTVAFELSLFMFILT